MSSPDSSGLCCVDTDRSISRDMSETKIQPQGPAMALGIGDKVSIYHEERAVPDQALPPYSLLTGRQMVLIIFLVFFAAIFSPLSFIFPLAVGALSQSLHTSVTRVNFRITYYMIIAGLAPAILEDLADNIGRRIVYIFIMSICCTANVGLALQSDWTALFLLTML